MKYIYNLFICIIIIVAFTFGITSQTNESGWIDSGKIKYQKFETDTLDLLKLSITGDTIFTMHLAY